MYFFSKDLFTFREERNINQLPLARPPPGTCPQPKHRLPFSLQPGASSTEPHQPGLRRELRLREQSCQKVAKAEDYAGRSKAGVWQHHHRGNQIPSVLTSLGSLGPREVSSGQGLSEQRFCLHSREQPG